MSAIPNHGISAPVLVPKQPNWLFDYSGVTTDQLVGMTDEQLAELDPLAVNLIVAKGTPRLADLDIRPYQEQVNAWAMNFSNRYLPFWTEVYENQPEFYDCDRRIFEVGLIQQFLAHEIGISYNEDQSDVLLIRFLNPSDLFLNGLLDTGQGTCGNMAALYVAFAWRMGWPVSLACNRAHFQCRYDDGEQAFNIEAAMAAIEGPGFYWAEDELQIRLQNFQPKAISSGSDLKALTPRERLGVFLYARARHFNNIADQDGDWNQLRLAERDCLLACYLFPSYRLANVDLTFLRALLSGDRFDAGETGHVTTYNHLCWEIQEYENRTHLSLMPMPPSRRPGDSVSIRSLSDIRSDFFASLQSGAPPYVR